MTSFKIAQDATFKADVEIPRVGFDSVKAEIEFRYRDRKELAKYYDKWNSERDAAAKDAAEHGVTWEQATDRQIELELAQLKEIIVGWNFPEKFSDESLAELVGSCAGAPAAVLNAYRKAFAVASQGN